MMMFVRLQDRLVHHVMTIAPAERMAKRRAEGVYVWCMHVGLE